MRSIKKTTGRHTIIVFFKSNDKEKIQKSSREKEKHKNKARDDSRFLIRSDTRKKPMEKHMKAIQKGSSQPRILDLVKISLKIKAKTPFFKYTKAKTLNQQKICTTRNVEQNNSDQKKK